MNIHLNDDELQIAIAGLSELPAKISYNLLTKLARAQAEETKRKQIALQPPPVDTPEPVVTVKRP